MSFLYSLVFKLHLSVSNILFTSMMVFQRFVNTRIIMRLSSHYEILKFSCLQIPKLLVNSYFMLYNPPFVLQVAASSDRVLQFQGTDFNDTVPVS